MGHDLGTHQRWYASWIDGESVMEEVDRYNAMPTDAELASLSLDPPHFAGRLFCMFGTGFHLHVRFVHHNVLTMSLG